MRCSASGIANRLLNYSAEYQYGELKYMPGRWICSRFMLFDPTFLHTHCPSLFHAFSGSGPRYSAVVINLFCCWEATSSHIRANSARFARHFEIRWCSLVSTILRFGKLFQRYRMNSVASAFRYFSFCNSDSVIVIVILGGLGMWKFFTQTFPPFFKVQCIRWFLLTLSIQEFRGRTVRGEHFDHPTRVYPVWWLPQCWLPMACNIRHLSLSGGFQISVCSTWHIVFVSRVLEWPVLSVSARIAIKFYFSMPDVGFLKKISW